MSFTRDRIEKRDGATSAWAGLLTGRMVGGSTGYSDWSDPVSHMSL